MYAAPTSGIVLTVYFRRKWQNFRTSDHCKSSFTPCEISFLPFTLTGFNHLTKLDKFSVLFCSDVAYNYLHGTIPPEWGRTRLQDV